MLLPPCQLVATQINAKFLYVKVVKIMFIPLQFVVEDFCPSQSLRPTILPQGSGIDHLWEFIY